MEPPLKIPAEPTAAPLPVTRFLGNSPFFPLPFVLALGALFFLAKCWTGGLKDEPLEFSGAAILVGIVVVLVSTIVLSVIPSRILIGVDGVDRRWLSFRRFTPMTEIMTLRFGLLMQPHLVLRNGKTVCMPMPWGRVKPENNRLEKPDVSRMYLALDAVFEQARNARAVRDERVDELLEKKPGETFVQWKERLLADQSGYRDRPIRVDDLWNAIADPWANPRVRVGAALVLGRTATGLERERLDEVTATSASPRLRVALERVTDADVDEAELEELLKNEE